MTLKTTFRTYLKRSLFALKLDLKRLSFLDNPHYRLRSLLAQLQIETVFDIGANTGQFALTLRELGCKNKIISFEPLSSAHKELLARSVNDESWVIYPRIALSNSCGYQFINVSQNSVSSSLSPVLSRHLEFAPNSKTIDQERVSISTLDNIFIELQSLHSFQNENLMLKVDAQGHEYQILQGARDSLQCFKVLLLELSVMQMYQDEKDMFFLCEWLSNYGFDLWSLAPAFADPKTGRILQYDGLFVRRAD